MMEYKDLKYDIETVSSLDKSKINELINNGYRLIERTIDVQLRTGGYTEPARKRFVIDRYDGVPDKEDILDIGNEAFVTDYRFHKTKTLPDPDAMDRLSNYIDEIIQYHGVKTLYVKYKEVGIAFLILTSERDAMRISLAAIRPKYQGTGLAKELYGDAIAWASDEGVATILGRIASVNTAVMNLYASFGAKFTDPLDHYVREKI